MEPHQKSRELVRALPVRSGVGHAPVRFAPVRHAVRRYKPPEGSPEGVPFSEVSSRAKRDSAPRTPPRLRRAKRTRSDAERSEAPPSEATLAPPSEARPREGHREVAITKKLKKVPPESPGEPLIYILIKAILVQIRYFHYFGGKVFPITNSEYCGITYDIL